MNDMTSVVADVPTAESYREVPAPTGGGTGIAFIEFYWSEQYSCDMIRFDWPGSALEKPHFAVTDEHKLQFPQQWNAYKNGQDQFVGQTIITRAPFLDEANARLLNNAGIRTVEMLAEATEERIRSLDPQGKKEWLAIRTRGIQWLEARRKSMDEETQRLASENVTLKAELEQLRAAAKEHAAQA